MDIRPFRPSFLKDKLPEKVASGPRQCRMCPTILPSWVKHYCSYACIQAAKADGSYGREKSE